MAELEKITGIIIRASDYGEADRILSILTAERGLLTVSAKGVRSLRSKNRNLCRIMCYGEFTVYRRFDYMWLSEISPIRDFYDVDMGLQKLSLCSYFFEVLGYVCFENDDCTELLQLLLNTLHVLGMKNDDRPQTSELTRIKTVFELRCAALLGFAPDLSDPSLRLGAAAMAAADYIVSAPAKRLFSFALEENELAALAGFAENYLISCTEHRFSSLDYYKSVII